MPTIEFLTQPIIRESKQVMVPVQNEFTKVEEKVPGVTQVFQNPVPLAHEMNFKGGRIFHQPKHQIITVIPPKGQRIEESILLGIAEGFGANQVKIKEWFQGRWGLSRGRTSERIQYCISYGFKSYEWDEPGEILQTVEGDIKYEPVLCYGFTRYGSFDNLIIHTKPIAQA